MNLRCDRCGLNYEREPGFYLGSIYVNYGVTAVLAMIGYFVGLSRGFQSDWLLGGTLAFCVLFPILIFRHARAVWLAFDQFWDPQESTQIQPASDDHESG
jgi:hypothetical protein